MNVTMPVTSRPVPRTSYKVKHDHALRLCHRTQPAPGPYPPMQKGRKLPRCFLNLAHWTSRNLPFVAVGYRCLWQDFHKQRDLTPTTGGFWGLYAV